MDFDGSRMRKVIRGAGQRPVVTLNELQEFMAVSGHALNIMTISLLMKKEEKIQAVCIWEITNIRNVCRKMSWA